MLSSGERKMENGFFFECGRKFATTNFNKRKQPSENKI